MDGLIHLSNGSAPDVLPVRDHVEVLPAAEEVRELLVDVPAAVEPRVDDDGLLADVQAERLLDDDTHARVVHRADVYVADPAARQLLDLRPAQSHPALVEQFVLLAAGDRLHRLVPPLVRRRVVHRQQRELAREAVEQLVEVHRGIDPCAVDGFDDVPGFDRRRRQVDGAALDHFGDSDAVARVAVVVEQPERSGRVRIGRCPGDSCSPCATRSSRRASRSASRRNRSCC